MKTRNTRYRFSSRVGCFLLLLLSLLGVSVTATTLTVALTMESQIEWSAVIEKYAEAHPTVDVQWIGFHPSSLRQRIMTECEAAAGWFDVVMIHREWISDLAYCLQDLSGSVGKLESAGSVPVLCNGEVLGAQWPNKSDWVVCVSAFCSDKELAVTLLLAATCSEQPQMSILGPDVAIVGEPIALEFETLEDSHPMCEVEGGGDTGCPEEPVRIIRFCIDSTALAYLESDRGILVPLEEGTIKVWAEYQFEGAIRKTLEHTVELVRVPTGAISLGAWDKEWPEVPLTVLAGTPIVFDVLSALTVQDFDPENENLRYDWDFGDGTKLTTFGNGSRKLISPIEEECEGGPGSEECYPLPPYMALHAFPAEDEEEYAVSVTVTELGKGATASVMLDTKQVKAKHIESLLQELLAKKIEQAAGENLSTTQLRKLKDLAYEALEAPDRTRAQQKLQEFLNFITEIRDAPKALVRAAVCLVDTIYSLFKDDPAIFDVKPATPQNGVIDGSIKKNIHYWVNDKPLRIKGIGGDIAVSIDYNFSDIIVEDNDGTLQVLVNGQGGSIKVLKNDEILRVVTNLGTIQINTAGQNNDRIYVNTNNGVIKLEHHDDELYIGHNLRFGTIDLINKATTKIGWNRGGHITIRDNTDSGFFESAHEIRIDHNVDLGVITIMDNDDDIYIKKNGYGRPNNPKTWGTINIEKNNDYIDIDDNGISGVNGKCHGYGKGGLIQVWSNLGTIEVAPRRGGRVVVYARGITILCK